MSFCSRSISVLHLSLYIGSSYADLLHPDGVLLTAVAQLPMNDEQSVKVKTDESGCYSTDTKAEAKGFSPSDEL